MELVFAILGILACLGVLAWLGSGKSSGESRGRVGKRKNGITQKTDDMREIGNAAGIMGPSIENAFIARFAIRRAKLAARKRDKKGGPKGNPKVNSEGNQ